MAINNPIITDSDWLQDTALAIQEKDGGGKIEVPDFANRVRNIPSVSDFDMTVTDNQVKMVIEVNDYDLSFWTRFGISGGGTVTVDWGDGTVDKYTGNTSLEYAAQRKHNYQKAGRYLVTETIENGILTTGSIGDYSVLSEGAFNGNINDSSEKLRYMNNYKLKGLAFGNNIVINGLAGIPYVKLYTEISGFGFYNLVTDYIIIKNGVTNVMAFCFNSVTAYYIKIPSSVTTISNNAFLNSRIRIVDFTDVSLNDSGELPVTFTSTNIFNGTSNNAILLFATQEIAGVAKNTTNLSVYADRIKYVGEEY